MPSRTGRVINRSWEIGELLGRGGFSYVYKARHMQSMKKAVLKVSRNRLGNEFMEKEASIYSQLAQAACVSQLNIGQLTGFLKYYGIYTIGPRASIIMERGGTDLRELITDYKKGDGFSRRCVSIISSKLLRQIYKLHSIGYIHRDIKPANILSGPCDDLNHIHLCDFGLAVKYRDDLGTHIEPSDDIDRGGTVGYGSMAFHDCKLQSRRDDLQSFVFVIIFLLFGRLPWSDISDEEDVILLKEQFWNSGSDTPPRETLTDLIKHVWELKFDEKPNYVRMERCLRGMRE